MWETSGYRIKLIDLTGMKGGDPLRHFSAGSSPSVVALVKGPNQTGVAILNDSDGNSGFFSDRMEVIEQGADLILRPKGGHLNFHPGLNQKCRLATVPSNAVLPFTDRPHRGSQLRS